MEVEELPESLTLKIAADFDGTICRHAKWPKIGVPVPGAIPWMKRLAKAGHTLILFTMRSGKALDEAVAYLDGQGVVLDGVNSTPGQHAWF